MPIAQSSTPTIPAYLDALSGYLPWIVVLTIVLMFKSHIRALLDIGLTRIRQGSSIKVGLIEIGESRLIASTADLAPELKAQQVRIEGNPDLMKLLMKAHGTVGNRTFSKSTKAMQLPSGCLVQVSTEVSTTNGELSAAEALSFVPGVQIALDADGSGGRLVPQR